MSERGNLRRRRNIHKKTSLAWKNGTNQKAVSAWDKEKSGKRMKKVEMTGWPTLNYESMAKILAVVTTKLH